MARRKEISRLSRRLTGGKLTLGSSRRPRRSRRVKLYAATAPFAVPRPKPRLPTAETVRRRWWVPVGALILTALLYLGFGTEWFYVYDIELSGNQMLSKEEIYQRTNLEAMSIFWLNPVEVRRRLLEEPAIARADISWWLPNDVQIAIQERTPVAVWQAGGQSLLVDASGTLYRPRGDATQYLVVHDLRDTPIKPGDTVDDAVVQAVGALAAAVPERTAFDWSPAEGLSFVSDEGWRVNFGDQTRMDVKVAAYQAFRSQVQSEQKILMLDLSNPERPYFQTEN